MSPPPSPADPGRPGWQRARSALALTGTAPGPLARSAALSAAATVLQLVSLGMFLPLVAMLLGDATGGRWARLLPREWTTGAESGVAILVVLAVIVVATAGRVVCGYAAQQIVARERAAAEARTSSSLMRALLGVGQAFFDEHGPRRLANRIRRLPAQLSRVADLAHDGLAALLSLAACFVALLLLSWPLALAAIAALAVYHLFYDAAARRLETMSEQLELAEDDAAAQAHELLSDLPLVHGHAMREREATGFAERAATVAGLRVEERRLLGLLEPLRDSAMVVLLLGFAGLVSLLPPTAATSGVTRYLIFLLVFRRALVSASRLLRLPGRWRLLERVVQRYEELVAGADRARVPSGRRELPPLRREIRVQRLSFGYAEGRIALDGLEARFPAGRRTWLVGASGSGKSTLLKLLVRLYDCPPDTILFDGVDLRELSTESLVTRVGWAPAEPSFFPASVRANLAYGRELPSDDELWRLAEELAIADLLRELPAGLDTDLGESASRLSTGERQRLALVRLFVRRPEILLVDEATAGLDATTERRVLQAFDRLSAGCTVVMVAHRLSNLGPDDEVLVLQRGRSVEQDRRDALLARGGALAELWAAQGLRLPPRGDGDASPAPDRLAVGPEPGA